MLVGAEKCCRRSSSARSKKTSTAEVKGQSRYQFFFEHDSLCSDTEEPEGALKPADRALLGGQERSCASSKFHHIRNQVRVISMCLDWLLSAHKYTRKPPKSYVFLLKLFWRWVLVWLRYAPWYLSHHQRSHYLFCAVATVAPNLRNNGTQSLDWWLKMLRNIHVCGFWWMWIMSVIIRRQSENQN